MAVVDVEEGLQVLLAVNAVLEGDEADTIRSVPVQEVDLYSVDLSNFEQVFRKANLFVLKAFRTIFDLDAIQAQAFYLDSVEVEVKAADGHQGELETHLDVAREPLAAGQVELDVIGDLR